MSNKVTETKDRVLVIDSLKSLLGTMVLFPEFTSDPNNIGQKIHKGNIQKPILEGENRRLAEDKLMSILKDL